MFIDFSLLLICFNLIDFSLFSTNLNILVEFLAIFSLFRQIRGVLVENLVLCSLSLADAFQKLKIFKYKFFNSSLGIKIHLIFPSKLYNYCLGLNVNNEIKLKL